MAVVDISCPSCGQVGTVEKESIGTYRCRACDASFSPADVADAGE